MVVLLRHIGFFLLLCALLLTVGTAEAQLLVREQLPMRFSGRLLSIYGAGGIGMYRGEFDGKVGGAHAVAALGYSVFPELAVAVTADVGYLTLERTPAAVEPALYHYQFRESGEKLYESTINYTAFDLSAQVNLFPTKYYNLFFSVGAGLTLYDAEDFDAARLRPSADFPASIAIPVGIGAEHFLLRNVSVLVQLRNTFLFRGDFDAYDPVAIAEEYNRTPNREIAVPSTGGDSFLSLSVGLRVFLFESDDFDGDLLVNEEEAELGTNPYHVDTDIDGLTDYEEVRIYTTDPVREDTDDDGLGDYFEITKYGTDPVKPDTDDDRLTDAEEIEVYNTDPRNPDTDEDMLSDYEEVIMYQTNPRNPDTDYDGLDDFAEVKVHKTNPLRPDTDDDGIFDFNEVVTYATNPLSEDTDNDLLLDYDEIAYYGTNPLNPDTDEDKIPDSEEVFDTRTNPLSQDVADEFRPVTSRPAQPYYAELVETRTLPGGGVSYLIEPVVSRRLPRSPGNIDSLVAALPRYDSTFVRRPGESSSEAYARYRRLHAQSEPVVRAQTAARMPLRIDSLKLRQGDMLSFCNITFEFDRDELREEYLPILRETAQLFRNNPGMIVEIRGHTDIDGEEYYNQGLSERRARTVREFLIAEGVGSVRLRTIGFGEHQPIADSDTEEGRALNRRVEFYILSLLGPQEGRR